MCNLVAELRRRGHLAELVSLPFAWHPPREIFAHAAAWRMLNLRTAGPHDVDLVIASRFPTYFVRHPRKVTWLIHQHRPAYELCGTPYGEFAHDDVDVGVRDTLIGLDRRMLAESRRIFANSGRVAARLEQFNGLPSTPLYHPPPLAGRLTAGPYGDYVLSVGRLEPIKRVDLVVRAMRHVHAPIRLVVAGDGRERPAIEKLIAELGLGGRVEVRRHVDAEALIELYAGALAVVYPPYDEDYGYVTLEAFLARKPVVTAEDSGGPLEFVDEGVTGAVRAPRPEALAAAIDDLAADRGRAAGLGDAGFARASAISWDHVIEALLDAPAPRPDASRLVLAALAPGIRPRDVQRRDRGGAGPRRRHRRLCGRRRSRRPCAASRWKRGGPHGPRLRLDAGAAPLRSDRLSTRERGIPRLPLGVRREIPRPRRSARPGDAPCARGAPAPGSPPGRLPGRGALRPAGP